MVKAIIDDLSRRLAANEVISPFEWLDAAAKLVALTGNETRELYRLQQIVAKDKAGLVERGMTVAAAKAEVESHDAYWLAKTQEALVKQAQEMVNVAKKMATVQL